jgi:hypothetical protein
VFKVLEKGHLVFAYAAYLLVALLLFITFSSVSTFFHFLLQHELTITENWLNQNKVLFVILSKFLAFVILYHLLKLNVFKVGHLSLNASRDIEDKVDWYLVFLLIFCFVSVGLNFDFLTSRYFDFEVYDSVVNFLGSIVYYIVDLFFLQVIGGGRRNKMGPFEIFFLVGLFTCSLFNIGQHVQSLFFIHSFVFSWMIISLVKLNKNWSTGLLVLLVLNICLYQIYPLQLFGNPDEAYFVIAGEGHEWKFLVICVIGSIYYYFKSIRPSRFYRLVEEQK